MGNVFNVTIVTAGGGGKVYFTVKSAKMMSHLRALGQGKLQQLLLHVAKPYLCQTVIPASEEFACSSF